MKRGIIGIIWIVMLVACGGVRAAGYGFRDSVLSVPVHRDSLRIVREPVLSMPVVFLPDSRRSPGFIVNCFRSVHSAVRM
mgnify:CR=1 FL=1